MSAPTDRLGFTGQANALGIGEAPGFASQLFQEDSILFLQILDDRLLVAVDPAANHKKQDLDLSIHAPQQTVQLRAAQGQSRFGSIIWPYRIPDLI